MEMKAKALSLVSKGYRVFPLVPNGKPPLLDGGFHVASGDPVQVSEWWEDHPDANIGLYPGEDTVVVDVDRKKVDGLDTILNYALEQDPSSEGELLAPVEVSTPSGGLHWYFRASEPWRDKIGVLPGVDIRGTHGYVVGPGSVIDGVPYDGVLPARSALPEVPTPLLPLRVASKADRAENASEAVVELDLPENEHRAIEFLEASDTATMGEGSDAFTYATAAKVREFGISEARCLELLLEHWNERCDPPWPADKLAVKVENAYRYANRPAGQRAASTEHAELLAAAAASAAGRGEDGAHSEGGDSDGAERPPVWRAYRGLAAIKTIPPVTWTIDGVLPQADIGILYGPSRTGKTFVALDLALSVAYSREWRGREVAGGNVVYLAWEGGPGLRDRLEAWQQHHGVEDSEAFGLVHENLPFFDGDVSNLELVDDFTSWINEEFGAAELVIIDTLSLAASGIDLNDGRQASGFAVKLKRLALNTGASVLLIGHTGKDEKRGLYGSQMLLNNVPTHLKVIDYDLDERTLQIIVDKQKDAADYREGWSFRLEEQAESLVAVPSKARANRGQQTAAFRGQIVKDILMRSSTPLTARALAQQMAVEGGDPEDKEAVARNVKFLRNIQSGNSRVEGLHRWCFKDGNSWLWAEPEASEGTAEVFEVSLKGL